MQCTQVVEALPELHGELQLQLLDLLSLVLARRPFNPYTPHPRFQALSVAVATGELQVRCDTCNEAILQYAMSNTQ